MDDTAALFEDTDSDSSTQAVLGTNINEPEVDTEDFDNAVKVDHELRKKASTIGPQPSPTID